jgi:hypothetical protein
MRQFICLFLGFVLCFPAVVMAGQIYGSVTSAGSGLAGATIEINCGGAITTGVTARDGSYRVNVTQQGQCTLTLSNYQGPPSAVVFSYPNPSRYDFELVKRQDGSYELRKR